MFDEVVGIKLRGANFQEDTNLDLFISLNNKLVNGVLIYGRNGAGKSTIAKTFKKISGHEIQTLETAELFDKDRKTIYLKDYEKKSIFVFDEDFVNDKVKIQKDGLGSIVMLGERADLTVEIEKARKNLEDAEKKLEDEIKIKSEYEDITNIKSPTYYMNKVTTELKKDDGWAGRDRVIKGSKRNTSVNNELYLKFKDLKPSKTKNDLLIEYEKTIQDLEKAKQGSGMIEEDILQISDEYKIFDYENANKLLNEVIEKPDLNEREQYLLSLVEKGEKDHLKNQIELFENENIEYCPFCLQDIEDEYRINLVNKVKSILSDVVEVHCNSLSKLAIDELNFDFTPFSRLKSYEDCINLMNDINISIQENNKKIQEKINSPYSPISKKMIEIVSKLEELEKAVKQLEKERKEYNSSIVNTKPIIDKLISINNAIAYYDIIVDVKLYEKQNLEYGECVKKEEQAKEEVNKKTKLVQDLEAKLKNIDIAVDLINDSLKYIFFSKGRLEIKVENGVYRLLSNGKQVLPNNISVGERNIIGLCYFFVSIFEGKSDKTTYKDEHLIIIDDPISSYDFENKIGILSFLKLKLSQFLTGNQNSKAIILTHDLLTSYDVEKILEEIQKECKICFEKKKIIYNLFELKDCKLLDFQYKKRHEYTELLTMIYEYAQEKDNTHSLVIGNIMRQVLEAFSTFEYKKGISEVSTDKNILDRISEEYQLYFKNLMYRLLLNGGSHKEEVVRSMKLDFFEVISDEEKVRTAKDILCFIYLLNNLHVIAHLGDISEELNKWCDEIKNK